MAQRGQDLALPAKAHHVDVGIEARAQQLERYLLLELAIRTLGEKDAGHAASADFPNESVGANASALPPWPHRLRVCQRGVRRGHYTIRQIVEVIGRGPFGVEKRLELPAERGIVAAHLSHELRALFARDRQHLLEECTQSLDARLVHG